MPNRCRLSRLRRGQPHVRDDGRLHQIPAEGVRGARQVRPGERPHQDRGAQRHLRLHPEPHVRGRGTPGRTGGVLQERATPKGKSPARDDRQGHPLARGLLLPRAAAQVDGRARPGPGAHVADAGEPARGAPRRRPEGHARRHPRAEPVDARALDLQLRGPHFPDARHHAAHRRARRSRSSSGSSSGAPRSCSSAPHRCRASGAGARSPYPSSTRSGSGSPRSTSRWACTLRTTG